MTELKPCPFCNGKAKWDKDWQAVVCTNCGASTRHSILVTRKKKEAIEAWNRRAVLEEVKGKEGKISPVWHTGTPTEEGWYLIAFNYEFEEGVRYTTDYFKDGKWAFPMVRDISKLRAWQRIEPFNGENNG